MMQSKMPSRRAQRRRLVLCVTAGVMLAGNLALATTYTWTRAANNNNWDSVTGGTTSNWATTGAINVPPPQTPASGDTTDLVYAGTVTFSGTSSSMRQDYTVDSITLAADFWHGAQATFNINTPSTLLAGATSAHLTIGAGGITSEIGNGVGTYNVSITRNALLTGDLILGADQTWKTNAPVPAPGGSAITFTINRPIVGDKTVTKSGTGVLVLQMTNGQNTGFTGTLVLQQGSIRTGGFDTSPNTHFGSAVLVANNPDDFTITASTVNTEGGERNFDNDLILRGGAGRLIFGGSFGLNFNAASTWTLETDKQIGSSIYTIHRGSITGNHGWTKTNGGMMILQGASDYTGIAAALLRAGAPSVIATLWTVNDHASSLLMRRFYEELIGGGHPPAVALRRAQLWLRDATVTDLSSYDSSAANARRWRLLGVDSQDRPYENPYFWAGYFLIGA